MYTAREHAAWVERLGNMMREVRQLQIEGGDLKEIHVTQGENGDAAAFTDVGPASKQEQLDGMDVADSYIDWLTGAAQPTQADRRPVTTAFLQGN